MTFFYKLPLKCPLCPSLNFYNTTALEKHATITPEHESVSECIDFQVRRRFECFFCGKENSKLQELDRHSAKHKAMTQEDLKSKFLACLAAGNVSTAGQSLLLGVAELCRSSRAGGDALPAPATSDALPTPATSDALPTPATSDALPTQATSDALPSLASRDALPSLATSDALPTQATSDALPTQATSDALPSLASSDALPALPTSDALPSLASRDALPALPNSALSSPTTGQSPSIRALTKAILPPTTNTVSSSLSSIVDTDQARCLELLYEAKKDELRRQTAKRRKLQELVESLEAEFREKKNKNKKYLNRW
jgi:hypothetical protein